MTLAQLIEIRLGTDPERWYAKHDPEWHQRNCLHDEHGKEIACAARGELGVQLEGKAESIREYDLRTGGRRITGV